MIKDIEYQIACAETDAVAELERAIDLFPPMHSAHEGYAVLLEEMGELWAEVTLKNPSKHRMRQEAKQVAAMALRFMIDVVPEED